MKRAVVVAVVALLAVAADKSAPENGPVTISIVNGRMAVKGKAFRGVADRVEWDAAKATVTLEGADDKPATFSWATRTGGRWHTVESRRIIFGYGTGVFQAEGVHTIRSDDD
jgi:hypothetical protein